MNIGMLPPIFLWPYAIILLIMGKSVWYMFNIIGEEQLKHIRFYEYIKNRLQQTARESRAMCEDFFHRRTGNLLTFVRNGFILYFGAIFLVLMKVYLLWRHLNFFMFSVFFYWTCFLSGPSSRNEASD